MSASPAQAGQAAFALAEALDFPHRALVEVCPENPLLGRLALLEGYETAWSELVGWMESPASTEEKLRELKRDYYQLFLQPGASLPIYLHQWFPEKSVAEFLGEWRSFLSALGVDKGPAWPNGRDHICLALEAFGHLALGRHERLAEMSETYMRPWLGTFHSRLDAQATNGYYRGVAAILRGLEDELQART